MVPARAVFFFGVLQEEKPFMQLFWTISDSKKVQDKRFI